MLACGDSNFNVDGRFKRAKRRARRRTVKRGDARREGGTNVVAGSQRRTVQSRFEMFASPFTYAERDDVRLAFKNNLRDSTMTAAVDYFGYDNRFLRIKTRFSVKARKKMYRRFLAICAPQPTDSVLDLGLTPDGRLEDSNLFEKTYPWKGQITGVSVEDCANIAQKYGLKRFVLTCPKRPLPFRDGEFDVLFCSVVLEHVGAREDQRFFLSECLRVANRVFLTTPNRWFPLEMHTFIPFLPWLPWSLFQKLVKPIRNGFWSDVDNLNLLDKRSLRTLSSDIQIEYIRTWGMRSNILIWRKNGR